MYAFIYMALSLGTTAPQGAANLSTLTLPEAIATALERAPETREANSRHVQATYKRKAATSALFPRVRAEASVQVWNAPLDIRFVDPASLGDTSAFPPQIAGTLEGLAKPFRAREQVTGNVSVTVVQPLVALYPLLAARKVETLDEAAAAAGQVKTEHDLALRVIEAYAQILAAESGLRTAEKGVALAQRFETRATSLAESGLLARTEVLKAHASLTSAEETLLHAQTGVTLSRAVLATLLKTDAEFALVEPAAVKSPGSLEDAIATMKRERPEMKELDARIAQSEQGVAVARSKMLPDFNILANYTYTGGNQFAAQNQFFVGAALGWDVWEWGNKWYQIDVAKARAEEIALMRERIEDQLKLDVRQAYTRLQVAQQTIRAAAASQAAAAEVYKSEESRFAAGQVTATDLTLSQTLYLQAENNLAAARYRSLVAAAALSRSMGLAPFVD